MSQAENTIVIAGAARTPVGSFNGAFTNVVAHEPGATAIRAAMQRANVESGDVSEGLFRGKFSRPAWAKTLPVGHPLRPAFQRKELPGI